MSRVGRKIKETIVEFAPLVACLPGYENANPGPMARNLTNPFKLKSSEELRLNKYLRDHKQFGRIPVLN